MKTIASILAQMIFMATLFIAIANPGLLLFAFRMMIPERVTMVWWVGQFFSS